MRSGSIRSIHEVDLWSFSSVSRGTDGRTSRPNSEEQPAQPEIPPPDERVKGQLMQYTKLLRARVSQSTRRVVVLRGAVSLVEVERRALLRIVNRVGDKVVDQVGVEEASSLAASNKVADYGVRLAIRACLTTCRAQLLRGA